MYVEFQKVRDEAISRVASLAEEWLSGKRQGREFHAINPTRNDSKPGSFNINLNTGVWDDFADASIDKKLKSDPVGLYAYLNNMSWEEAARVLAVQFGIAPERGERFQYHSKLGKPSLVWQYNEDFYVYRFETKDSKGNPAKEFRPVSWNFETNKWQWKDPKGKLPLYHLKEIRANPDARVVFCEGEKATDAAKKFFPKDETTTTAHGSKSPQRTNFKPLKGRSIIIWQDNDEAGLQYADELIELLLINGEVAKVEILIIPDDFPKKGDAADAPDDLDISMWELVDQTHMREVFNRPQSVSTNIEVTESEESEVDSNWVGKLKTNAYGCVTNTKTNIRDILSKHPDWHGVVGYNEFNHGISKRKPPPYPNSPNKGLGEWTDADNEMLSMWFGENYDFEPSCERLQSLVVAISMGNPFNPIKDYLESCHQKWLTAGSPKGHVEWCEKYFGATGSQATKIFQKTWLISAVARVFEPGCKADNVLILEGKQGYLKSTALSVLGGKWFSDSTIDFGDKDSLMLIHENWIIEMPELDKFKKADSDRAKSFFAKREDKYRAPYGHNLITMHRQCVFVGTTNTSDYLKDSTGNRRYMPIECLQKCDIDLLRKDRDLIWGEAVSLYKKGEPWWYDDTLDYVQAVQNERYAEDVWSDVVEEYLMLKNECTIQLILTEGIKVSLDRCDKMSRNRVADILRGLGWRQSSHVIIDGKRKKGWKRPLDSVTKSSNDATNDATDNMFQCYDDIITCISKGDSWERIRMELIPKYGAASLDQAKKELIDGDYVDYNQRTDILTLTNIN